jgi:uncharacterized protein DUF6265
MLHKRSVVLALMVVAGNVSGAVTDLHWLAGAWCGTNQGVVNEEVWLPPRAGSLVGVHRDSKDGRLRGFEYFRIVEDGDDLVYWAQPNGIAAVAFRARTVGANAVDFLNPAHDFPKRVSYRRIDQQTLVARIDDGTDRGQRIEWTWRLDCGSLDR